MNHTDIYIDNQSNEVEPLTSPGLLRRSKNKVSCRIMSLFLIVRLLQLEKGLSKNLDENLDPH